jgi:hypothetical protein
MILLRNALDIMDTGEPFHVTVVTCDTERNTGGKIIKFGPAVLNRTRRKKFKSGKGNKPPKVLKRRNNEVHNTRTIRLLGSEQIRTIHVQLITEFNGEKVI